MKPRIRAIAVLVGLPAILACCSSAGASTAAAGAVSPLPASDYAVRHVCAAPAPGYAGCLALELVPRTAAARARVHPLVARNNAHTGASTAAECAVAYAPSCLTPQDLHSAYALPATASSPQTIAIVDAYNDLGAEADLKVYDKEFGLPECTGANKCFEQVNQSGETGNPPFPANSAARTAEELICQAAVGKTKETACEEVEEADGWAGEISLDIEVAHAVCQNCRVALVEANSAFFPDLETAEETAAGLGATEISNSWGGPECSTGTRGIECGEDSKAFDHHGVVITAAAGDNGYLDWSAEEGAEKGFADYPASSPHVIAVGGTRLALPLGAGNTWTGETVWNGDGAGGSGCSISFAAPAWQSAESDWSTVGCGSGRAVADVSADADPHTGVAIYDSTPEHMIEGTPGWITIGGTSLASPLIASTFALAGGASRVAYPAQTLYENELEDPASLHDVVSGSNGECKKEPLFQSDGTSSCSTTEEAVNSNCLGQLKCNAAPGYDGPTGVGTPNGITAFEPVSEEVRQANEAKRQGETKLREVGSGGEAREGFAGLTLPAGAHPAGPLLSIPGSSSVLPILSSVSLTRRASIALRHDGPVKISRIAFAFTLNVPARVRVTLAVQVLAHGHRRWRSLPDSLAISAAKGRDSAHLRARGTLSPGRYRLTLTPLHGRARTLTFRIG